MSSSAEAWDARYLQSESASPAEPDALLREFLPLLPRGRALDLAMGAGRNAVFLAAQGWQVTGVDWSRAALEQAAERARQSGLRVEQRPSIVRPARSSQLVLVLADLERSTLPENSFDVVVCLRYLQRSLFPAIERALRVRGVLLYQTYTVDHPDSAQRPRDPQHLLRRGELRDAFSGLKTLFYRELCAQKGIASLAAVKP